MNASLRVVARFKQAGLKSDLVHLVQDTKAELDKSGDSIELIPLTPEQLSKLQNLVGFLRSNFRIDTAKTPRGQKPLKEQALRLLNILSNYTLGGGRYNVPSLASNVGAFLDLDLDSLVRFFSAEGDSSRGRAEVLSELKGNNATFYNRSNMSTANFKKYVASVDGVLSTLRGWRRKALAGNLKVVFVGGRQMKVQGKYRQATDELWVKATPAILKRSGGTYASPDYIIIHELGHRYEKFNPIRVNFDDSRWQTSRYSYQEGEAFPELFAIGHYGLNGPWDQSKIEAFEKLMA